MDGINLGYIQNILQVSEALALGDAVPFSGNVQKFLIFVYNIDLIHIGMPAVDGNEFQAKAQSNQGYI